MSAEKQNAIRFPFRNFSEDKGILASSPNNDIQPLEEDQKNKAKQGAEEAIEETGPQIETEEEIIEKADFISFNEVDVEKIKLRPKSRGRQEVIEEFEKRDEEFKNSQLAAIESMSEQLESIVNTIDNKVNDGTKHAMSLLFKIIKKTIINMPETFDEKSLLSSLEEKIKGLIGQSTLTIKLHPSVISALEG